MSATFQSSARERLTENLQDSGRNFTIATITPDASNRNYFRIEYSDSSEIACVYPEQFDDSLPQLDVTELFLAAGLPVAKVDRVDFARGIVFHADFGDKILRDELKDRSAGERQALIGQAITLIAEIQASTKLAFDRDSIASRLRFDEEKLLWELNFFRTHFCQSLNGIELPADLDSALTDEFTELARELEGYAEVLTHRDFHAANLMIGETGELLIIDHQDARIGSAAYDLVSLLLDRITDIPDKDWIAKNKAFLMEERRSLQLPELDPDRFDLEFDLTAVQRCLKAIGTFSNQAANLGKRHYIQFIDPMFLVVDDACRRLGRFPAIRELINSRPAVSE